MSYLRAMLAFVMVGYAIFALITPGTFYVKRFLFMQPFHQWVPLQIYPSMYSSEIIIHDHMKDRTYSTVHHPMRIFYENKDTDPPCGHVDIAVRYGDHLETSRFRICGDTLRRISNSIDLEQQDAR